MQPIEYNIQPIRQKASECMQTATTQLLSYFDPSVQLTNVLRDVPVYVENGEKIGTSPGHLVAYIAQQGYQTIVHMFDVELFDISWQGLDGEEVIVKLKQRQACIPDNSRLAKYHHILVDGWEQYTAAGGSFSFGPLTTALLHDLLTKAPYIIMVNSTYLNRSSRQAYNQDKDTFIDSDIKGRSLTHAVTCAGYKDGDFLIVDPDPPAGTDHQRWIPHDHLIASIMSAQTESDNFLISVRKDES